MLTRLGRSLILAVLALVLSPALAAAARAPSTQPDTSGEGVVRRFVEASGGGEAYAKVKSRLTTGTIATQGVNGDITITQKAPNLVRITGNVAGVVFDRGFDGTTAFEVNSATGTRLIEGSERDLMQMQSLVNPLEIIGTYFQHIENLGVEQLDGRDTYKVELTTKDSEKLNEWFDVESGLLTQTQFATEIANAGKIEIVITFSDWQDQGGVKVPMRMKQLIQPYGIEQVYEFTKMETNVDLPADRFALPDEVKELVKANAATTQPAGGK